MLLMKVDITKILTLSFNVKSLGINQARFNFEGWLGQNIKFGYM